MGNISCSMTNRAAVDHATIGIVNEEFEKNKLLLRCHLHPLELISSKCKLESLGNLYGIGCGAEKIILGINKMRFIDGKGNPQGFSFPGRKESR